MKISEYVAAAVADLRDRFGEDWEIYARPDGTPHKVSDDAWGVEIWVPSFRPAGRIAAPRARLLAEARVTYGHKSGAHASFHQAQDIGAAVMAYLIEKSPPNFSHEEERSDQIIELDAGTYLVGAGQYEVILSWNDTIEISSSIEIEGPGPRHRRPPGGWGPCPRRWPRISISSSM